MVCIRSAAKSRSADCPNTDTGKSERYSNPITDLDRPSEFQEVEAPRFQDSRHIKVVRLLALRTSHLYPVGNIPNTHFCKRLSRPQGHSEAGRNMSMKNSSDNIGNRTRGLLACSAVPQPTAPSGAPDHRHRHTKKHSRHIHFLADIPTHSTEQCPS